MGTAQGVSTSLDTNGLGLVALLLLALATPAQAQFAAERVTNQTIRLNWADISDGRPVTVWVGEKAGKRKGKPLIAGDRDGGEVITFHNGKSRPYFYVKPKERKGRWVAERFLPLEGGQNFRDMGGYAAKDGKYVRWGKLYRSGSPGGLTKDDYSYLGRLGIRSVCDLRSTEERKDEPGNWEKETKADYWMRDYSSGAGNLRALFEGDRSKLTAENTRAMMMVVYRTLPQDQAPAFKKMFADLQSGRVPLAFNCTAGKDRTGVGAALILTALGVPYETVAADFLLSNAAPPPARRDKDSALAVLARAFPPEALKPLLGVERAYLDNAFAAIRERYGSVETFLETELGVDKKSLKKLRSALLE